MKKFITALFSFALLTLSATASAQTAYQLYVSDIKTEKPQYSVGETIQGEFTLFNVSEIGQSDIYYTISSGEYSEEELSLVTEQGTTDKTGPFYLKGKSKETIPFQYTLPESLTGASAIQINVILKDGTFVAQNNVSFDVTGDVSSEYVSVYQPSIQVSDIDSSVSPHIGVIIYEGETAQFNYMLSPTKQAIKLTPTLKLYDRTDNAENLIDTIVYDSITTDSEESAELTTHSIDLPTDIDPLVYYGVLSFEGENVDVEDTDLRYIIAGPIATIRNITTETLEVQKGESFSALLTYGGQPFDEVRPELQTASIGVSVDIFAYNEKGEEIAKTTSAIDLNDESRSIQILFENVKESAGSLSFSAIITDSDGNVLDEYQTKLPGAEDVKNQETLVSKKLSISFKIILTLISLFVLTVLLIIFKKKQNQFKIPTVIIAGALIIASGILYTKGVSAWETIVYEVDGKTQPVNFHINTVASPLPPEVKIYKPGEKFQFTFSASFGDCANESRMFQAYLPSSKTGWETMKPSGKTLTERLAYWQKEGENVFYFRLGGPGLYDRAYENGEEIVKEADDSLVANTDFVESFGISVKKESDIKTMAKAFGIYYQPTTYGWHNQQSGVLRIYSEETWLAVRIKNEITRASRVKNLEETKKILVARGYNNPKYKNFDFTDVSNIDYKPVYETIPWHRGSKTIISEYQPINQKSEDYRIAYKAMRSDAGNFANGTLQLLFTRINHSGGHSILDYDFTQSRTYTAPTKPGYHKIYGYLYQWGNVGGRDILFSQEICVAGSGVCPNEVVKPVLCPNLTGTFTKNSKGKILQNGVVTDYVEKANGNCVIPPPTCNGNYTEGQLICINGQEYAMSCGIDGKWIQTPTGRTCGTITCNGNYTEGQLICINGQEYAMSCGIDGKWKQNPTGKTCAGVQHLLTVTKTGTGTVTSSPAGISCGADCTQLYNQGTSVTLTATPGTNQRFTGWGGSCSGTSTTCTVPMSQARTVTATFAAALQYSVVFNANGGTGTMSTQSFLANQTKALSANRYTRAGYTFAGWATSASGAVAYANQSSFTMNPAQNRILYAKWTQTPLSNFTLTVNKSGSGTGTVTSNPSGVSCGSDCTQSYAPGTSVTLSVNPGVNSGFAGWTGSCGGLGTCTVSMTQNRTVQATFVSTIVVPPPTGTTTTTFIFSPSVANSAGTCNLELEAQNVSSCSLVNRVGTPIPLSVSPTGSISITSLPVDIGTWTLTCTGLDGSTTAPVSRSCMSNPTFGEF